MKIHYNEQDEAFRRDVRAFIRQYFTPESPYLGSAAHQDLWETALVEKGWSAYKWPAEHGGIGWNVTQKSIWERETSLVGVPDITRTTGTSMLGPILYTYGNEEQKAKYLPDILKHRVHWCQGYSEPGAGSDLARLSTRAVRDGSHYVVNGSKIWTSGADSADMMFALVRTSKEERKQLGISFLLIDMKSPGITIQPILTLDLKAHFCQVIFEDARVPVANRIGKEGSGWTYAKGLLTHERTGQALVSESIKLLREIKSAAAETLQNGSPLIKDPDFAQKIATLEIELKALEFTELRTLSETEAGAAPGAQSSILKLTGTQVIQNLTELFIDCLGYFSMPYPLEGMDPENPKARIGPAWGQPSVQFYMHARAASIAGGTDEIMKNIIAKHVLGL